MEESEEAFPVDPSQTRQQDEFSAMIISDHRNKLGGQKKWEMYFSGDGDGERDNILVWQLDGEGVCDDNMSCRASKNGPEQKIYCTYHVVYVPYPT